MGGYGSGKGRITRRKKTVEQTTALCVFAARQAGDIQSGQEILQTTRGVVRLTWTSCNYGAARPWLVCPACHRRAGKLYPAAQKGFACRLCLDLAHTCQYEAKDFRLLRKAGKKRKVILRRLRLWQRLYQKSEQNPYPRPFGMWWSTYWRLMQEANQAELRAWLLIVQDTTSALDKVYQRMEKRRR